MTKLTEEEQRHLNYAPMLIAAAKSAVKRMEKSGLGFNEEELRRAIELIEGVKP